MTAEERLEKVRRYVSDEMRLSREQAQRWEAKGDTEQYRRWIRRYDVLCGVMIAINY